MSQYEKAESVDSLADQPKKKSKVWRMLKLIVGIYIAILLLIFFAESKIMFPGTLRPWREMQADDELEIVKFKSGKFELQGLLCQVEKPDGAVVFCHGNGDLTCYMGEDVKQLAKRFNVTVLAFDYRGYGKSEGSPTANGCIADGQAAYDYLKELGFSSEKIFVYGESLGGAIAVSIASNNEVAGMGLKSTFSSMTDVAASKFPIFPVRLLLRNRFPSEVWIADYKGPLVQWHGEADEVVGVQFGRKLHEAAKNCSSKIMFTDPGYTHNVPPTEEFWIEFGKMLELNDIQQKE